MIDLVAGLAVGQPLFAGPYDPAQTHGDWRQMGNDALAIMAVVGGDGGSGSAQVQALRPQLVKEARAHRTRLRRAFGLSQNANSEEAPVTQFTNTAELARLILAADPRSAHVRRERGKHIMWSNGAGREIELASGSALWCGVDTDVLGPNLRGGSAGAAAGAGVAAAAGKGKGQHPLPEAVAVLQTHGVADKGGRSLTVLATCAVPLKLSWLAEAKLGHEQLCKDGIRIEGGVLRVDAERLYAKRVIASHSTVPRGQLAREALGALYLRGTLKWPSLQQTKERVAAASLAQRLWQQQLVPEELDWCFGGGGLGGTSGGAGGGASGRAGGGAAAGAGPRDCGGVHAGGSTDSWDWSQPVAQDVAEWVQQRLLDLGFESGDDLALLGSDDLRAPALPEALQAWLDNTYPQRWTVAGATFEVSYDLQASEVVLRDVNPKNKVVPPAALLLPWRGFGVVLEHRGKRQRLRGRGGRGGRRG